MIPDALWLSKNQVSHSAGSNLCLSLSAPGHMNLFVWRKLLGVCWRGVKNHAHTHKRSIGAISCPRQNNGMPSALVTIGRLWDDFSFPGPKTSLAEFQNGDGGIEFCPSVGLFVKEKAPFRPGSLHPLLIWLLILSRFCASQKWG